LRVMLTVILMRATISVSLAGLKELLSVGPLVYELPVLLF